MLKDIRFIASDLDGTLLDHHSKMTPKVQNAILAAQKSGIMFAACTGRFPENASLVMADAGIDCPVISLNGACIELSPFGEMMYEQFMDPASAYLAMEALEAMGEGYFIFGKGFVVSRLNEFRHHSEVDFSQRPEIKSRIHYDYGLPACQQAITKPVYKFYVYLSGNSQSPESVRAALGGIPGISLTQSSEQNVELMPSHVDKGTGLMVLTKRLGLTANQVMAMGDQLNDLPMLRYAGVSYAMGNASETIKKAATFVTADHQNGGAADAILQVLEAQKKR